MENQEDPKELISEKAEERNIPVFTVLKNNAILKNIFLLDNPAISEESEKDLEEILMVGRHPDCNITLEHPSISRFHLRIHSNPSSQSLSIVDLSSVHGTWIAGKKIEPGVRVKLQEGDTMKLGGSSRVYRLHWIPLSCAYDMENPFLPPIQESESVKEGEGEGHQVEDGFLHENDYSVTKSNESEGTDALRSDTDVHVPTMKSLTPSPAPLSKDIDSPISNEEKVESQTENAGSTSLGSQKRSALNIWSRRGKASSVLIQTGRDAKKSSRISFCSEIKSEKSFSKGLFQSGDMGEKVFAPDKENSPPSSLPLGSLRMTDELDLKSGSTMKSSILNADEVDETVASEKDSVTVKNIQTDTDIQSFSKDLFQSGDMGEKPFTPDKENSPTSSLPLGSTMKSSLLNVDEVDEIVAPDKENETMNIQLLSGGADEETFTPYKQMLTPNKENQSPSSVPVRFLFDLESSVKSSVGEIAVPAPLSGYVDEEEMSAPDKGNLTPASFPLSSLKNTDEFDLESGLTMKSSLANVDEVDETVTPNKENITSSVHFLSEGMDKEEMFTPGKENCTPSSVLLRSLKKTCEVDLKSRSTMDEGDDEIVTPNKENVALNTHLLRSIKQKGKLENPFAFSLENDKCDDEIFTPDKENMTPNTHFLWSMNKIGKYRETKNHTGKANEDDSLLSMNKLGKLEETISSNIVNPPHQYEGMSVEKANHNEKVLQEQILTCAIASNQKEKGLNLQSTHKGKMHRVPLQSVSVNSRSKTESNYSKQDVHPLSENIVIEENKRWCMVVDTTSLLNKESRKALQLLQGLKRTSLIVPRIVIRELDCMKRRPGFFRRTTEVTSALEWVEDCMINTKWWIHVQSSEEEASAIPPTPPATTPASLFSFDSLFDIVSPTAEDHILEYALSLRKINNGQQLVLLSDDVTLKIKSMAEGLLCETASDFRESLVNPFSERFLWTESSPRGTTWSTANGVVLKETYYHNRSKKDSKLGESARGLKLILLHNSRYRQFIH